MVNKSETVSDINSVFNGKVNFKGENYAVPFCKSDYNSNCEVLQGKANSQKNATCANNLNEKKTPISHKICNFIQYAVAPVAALILFIAFVAASGIYPFGDNMMSSYDMLAQIAPFAEHFFDVLEGKSSLFYSFSVAGGADVFGTLAYCMVSPFSFLFLVMGRGNVSYTVPFVLAAKIVCIALSSSFAIKKLFPSMHPFLVPVIALLYTYSGYFHVANTYINWLDFMIYTPLIVYGFRVFKNTGNYIWFSVFLACNIYACFSIACFSMIIIFLILFAYVLFCVDKPYRKQSITKICLSLILAVAFALPVIVPSFMAYMRSGRNTGLFSNLNNKLSADHLYNKLSYVLCDVVLFVLSVFYVVFCNKKNGFNRFLIVTSALILAPVLIDEICLLLNAGSYMSYALRFGFLNSVLKTYLACLAICNAGDLKTELIKNTKTKNNIISLVVVCVVLCACAFCIYTLNDITSKGSDSFVFKLSFMKEGTPLYKLFEEADFSKSFSSKFAHSIGGLEIIVLLFFVFGIGVALISLLNVYKVMNIRIAAVALAVIGCMQIGFTCYHTVIGNKNTMVTYDRINQALDIIKEEEDDLTQFRIKDYSNAVTADAPFTLHYRAYSVFSSVTDDANFAPMRFFKYDGNGINTIKTKNGNVFSDALMGYKYAYSSGSISRAYWQEFGKTDKYKVYKNKYVFPTAFYVPGGELDFKTGTDADKYDRLYNFLGGEGNLISRTKPYSVEYVEEGGFYKVRMRSATDVSGNAYVMTDFPDDLKIEYCSGSTFKESEKKVMSAKFVSSGSYTYGSAISSYYCLKSDDVRLTEELINDSMFFAVINEQKVMQLSETANSNAAHTTFGSSNVTCTFNADKGGYLFLNYINIDGWSAEVNGVKTQLKDNGLNFIIVETQSGYNTVSLNYTSLYVTYIFIGLLVGGILAFSVIMLFKYYNRNKGWMEAVADFSADVLAVFVLGFGFIYPAVLFIIKCFKAVIGLF